jgi:pSer/pThr/pTyr-binding forkhead associated (FHA) protein
MAFVRSLTTPSQLWSIRGGMMRIGSREGNDLVLQYPGISREHAEIVYRESSGDTEAAFYLRDRSRYGTWISQSDGWQKVHNQEVAIASNTQIKFGNPRTQALEFVVDG